MACVKKVCAPYRNYLTILADNAMWCEVTCTEGQLIVSFEGFHEKFPLGKFLGACPVGTHTQVSNVIFWNVPESNVLTCTDDHAYCADGTVQPLFGVTYQVTCEVCTSFRLQSHRITRISR